MILPFTVLRRRWSNGPDLEMLLNVVTEPQEKAGGSGMLTVSFAIDPNTLADIFLGCLVKRLIL